MTCRDGDQAAATAASVRPAAQQAVEGDPAAGRLPVPGHGVEEDRKGGFERAQRRDGRREVTAGRKTGDSHAVRGVAVAPASSPAMMAQRLHGVFERHFGMAFRQTVFEYGGRDAVGGEPPAASYPS